MKTILFLLSFMFVSCVTANPESRDLSAVNTAKDENIKTAFFWSERRGPFKYIRKKKQWLKDCLGQCINCFHINKDQQEKKSCESTCMSRYSQKEGVKVASIGDQNPFNLLKESQSEDREDNNHTDKDPLMFAGVDECVYACMNDCIHEDDCRAACK